MNNIDNEKIESIDITLIDNFINHPFKVIENEDMKRLKESVSQNGILEPIIVRKKNDRYEIISGHRRKYVAEVLGNKKIPCIIKNMNDFEATILMVDSNLHRENILPSEKAKAYKMKLDAVRHQGKRTLDPSGPKLSISILEESKEFLNDITTRDQRMFLCIIGIVHISDFLEKLNRDTESIISIGNKHLCQIGVLKYQQLDGLNTLLPYGINRINTLRTLTTESLAVFMPFRVQDINHDKGIYYGENVISKNMIIADRKQLLNGNSFILGVSGSGKSFTAKNEIVSIALRDPNADIIILTQKGNIIVW